MRPLQLTLLVGLISALALYLSFFRSSLRDRMLALGFFLSAAAVAIFPDLSELLVATVGLGRSTDIVLYLFSIASLFCIILLYSKAHKLERDVTQVVRHLAIVEALKPTAAAHTERAAILPLPSRQEHS